MPRTPLPQNAESLRSAYERFGGLVFRRARTLLGDEHAARDVTQEVFVRVLQARPVWAPPSPVGWLYTTTTRLCLNLLRDDKRRARLLRAEPAASTVEPAAITLALLLRSVPTELHEVAVFACVDGMSQDDIAVALGISQKTVSNRLRDLRRCLDQPDLQPPASVARTT